jgi:hypothetical protein
MYLPTNTESYQENLSQNIYVLAEIGKENFMKEDHNNGI